MDPDIKEYILRLIKTSFVHPTLVNDYSVYLIGSDISDNEVMLTVKYSHTDAADVWCEYEIQLQKTPVYRLILPINIPIHDKLGNDILEILTKCSQKIIIQEKLAQKNMFLHAIKNHQIGQAY
jgi:hypothetical protein